MADRDEFGSTDTADLRNYQIASIRRSASILVVLAIFACAFVARDLLLPVIGGILICLTLRPLLRGMQRIGLSPALSAITVMFGIAAIIAGAIVVSAGAVNTLVAESGDLRNDLRLRLSDLLTTVENVKDATKEVESMAGLGDEEKQEVVVETPSLLNNAMSTLSRMGSIIAVALVLATFLLASGDMFLRKLVQGIPLMKDKKRALTTVLEIERSVSRYLLTITIINFCLGIFVGAMMVSLGLPYPYIWGILAFCLNFLPYLGGVVGVIMVAAFSLVSFDSFSYALLPPAAYLMATAVEGQFLTPWLVGRNLAMNPVAVFLAVVLWGWMWGIPGALIAVPILVVFKVICDNVDRLKGIGRFIGGADEAKAPPGEVGRI